MTKILNGNKYLAERMNGRGFLVGLVVDGKVTVTLAWLWPRVLLAVFMQFSLLWDVAPDCTVNLYWGANTGSSCHCAAWMNECCRTDNMLPHDRSHLLRYVCLSMVISGGDMSVWGRQSVAEICLSQDVNQWWILVVTAMRLNAL